MKSKRGRPDEAKERRVPHGPINDLMVKAGLTQTQFAKKIKVHKTVVNHWVCQGKRPSVDKWDAVAKVLNVDILRFIKLVARKRAA